MRKSILQFLLLMFATVQLFAQQEPFKVQGIPRPDLSNNQSKATLRLKSASSDDMYDYSTFSLDSIKFWVGSGTNRAALIIDWYDGKGTQTAMVWGYRWHQDSIRTGLDMLKAIAKADKKFLFLTHYTGPMGNTIAGLGYDLNNSGNQSLIFNNDTENPHYPVNGIVTTTAYDYDSWTNSDPADHWQAGWYGGYWSYQVKNPDDETFVYSGLGASSRILEDGSLDGWCYQDFASGGGMFDGTLPRMPFVYTPSPYTPFPNYTAYWAHMRKDPISHMPVVDAPLAIRKDSLVEKWKLTGIGGMTSGGQTLIVNGNLYLVHNNKLKIINRETGATITETTMSANAGFFAMMAYGEGKIFVPLANGVLQAFRADDLKSIWKTESVTSKQQLCEVTYHDGYVYTGMWQSGATGTFYCVKAEDEDPSDELEIKPRVWESFNKGYYWSGGTIVDNAIIFGGDLGALESRDRLTGELLDSIQITGTIRCGTSFDKNTRNIFFTAKEEQKVYSVKVNANGTFDKTSLKSGALSGQATTVPVMYNGRIYITSGTMTSGGGLDVIDATTLNKIYSANIGGISQATPLISTGYANESNKNTVYLYVTLNNANGSIVCVKDFEGNTEPIIQYSVVPSSKQYCTHSLVADEQGSIYYKNDAGALIAYTSKPTYEVSAVALNISEKKLFARETVQLTASVLPANADNKNVSWTTSDAAIATVSNKGLVTALTDGEAYIFSTTEDGSLKDSCLIKVVPAEYTDGVFFVNEDWFGHNNSTVNFLDNEGNWHYRIYQNANPGKELGATSQFGTIYGDKFFIVSKQDKDPGATVTGSRLAVCDAKTMESLAEFTTIGGADGRSFLGVNEHKGYIGTSNGIYVFDMDNLSIGAKVKGTENTTGSLYSGQIGTMVRAADKIFAVHQQKGVLVIDIENDSVQTVVGAPLDGTKQRGFGSIVQSKDGNLWLSVATNTSGSGGGEDYLLKLNPYTLDTTRVALPSGGSVPNSWYAWTADGFCASTQNNKLYWKNNGGWFNATKIYEYDIDNEVVKTVIDFSTYEPAQNWGIYGAGFRLDPVSDDIYVSLYKEFMSPTYKVAKVNTTSGTVTASYPMTNNYWFPAMPVFPDNEAPVVSGLSDINVVKDTVIYLGDKASDADNMQVAIVKSLQLTVDETLINACIANDSLYITSNNTSIEPQTTSLTVKFNSNGKLVEKTVQVNVAGRDLINVTSISLSKKEIALVEEDSHQLTATILPENADNRNFTWTSSNTAIATVENGLVTAIAEGTANIIVVTEDGELSDTCAVTVTPKTISVASVSLNEQTIDLVEEETFQLVATVLPENATNKNVTWESSNTAIATVDENGLVTAIAKGTANITVTTVDGELSESCSVTVTEKIISVASVTLNEQTISIEKNETYQLVATVLPENATNKNVTWESSNTAIATVDENGLVTAIGKGTATITVTTIDGEFTASCEVTVTDVTTGIEQPEMNKNKVYPTVTTGLVHIVLQGKTTELVQVVDISGKALQTIHLQSTENTIDLSSYKSGMYLIRLGNQTVKIIKQ